MLKNALQTILSRTNTFKELASIDFPDVDSIKEGIELYDDMIKRNIKQEKAIAALVPVLEKLSTSLDTMLKIAQSLDPKCQILKNQHKGEKEVEQEKPAGVG